jgi:Domain of unknown function (DUF4129)
MKLGPLAQVVAAFVLVGVPVCSYGQDTVQPASTVASQAPASDDYNILTFTAELSRLEHEIGGKPAAGHFTDMQKALPSYWHVATPERTFTISTGPFRLLLRADTADKATAWLENLRHQVDSYSVETTSNANAASELQKILSDSRFAKVQPPGPWDRFRQRVNAWLAHMLQEMFRSIGRHPLGAEILFWLLVVAAVGFVALMVYRFFLRREQIDELHAAATPIIARSWQEWVRAAREAAARADYREAIHSAYWAGITRLQDAGALPRDRAKTPREYLRALVTPRSDAIVSNEQFKDPLAKLTSHLERAWYANRGARSEDFADTLHQLEALGCPLD